MRCVRITRRGIAVTFLLIASGCTGGVHQSAGATYLHRPLRLHSTHAACPASTVRPINLTWGGRTGGISGYAVGKGPVVLLLSEESAPIQRATVDGRLYVDRAVVPLGPSSLPGWGALKTTWVSLPTYKGAYVVRGHRLDGNGPVGIGGAPGQNQFLLKPGTPEANLAEINGGDGYRPAPGYIWLKVPGCYGFQIDGATFSDVITINVTASP